MLLKKRKKYSNDEKVIAQNINFYSARTYNYLRDSLNFKLPSNETLIRWAPLRNVSPGFNPDLLLNLKEIVSNMSAKGKEAILVFDEIKIKSSLEYNSFLDEIQGFENDGVSRKLLLGKQVCVFMVKGLYENWKYVLSYFLTSTGIKNGPLKDKIESNIEHCNALGLNVRAVTSDQGSNNRAAFKNLNISPETPSFKVNNKEIFVLYDAPHLIKSLRNMLMTRNLKTPDGTVSWDIIRQLYELDQNSVRLCPKLTTKHIFPNAFEKMKVKYATQIFSHSVASAILTAVKSGKFSGCQESALATATFIEKINKLFDCLNSYCLYDRNPHKCALQANNIPYEYLQDMKNYFQNLHYPVKVYCIEGMVQTISSILGLANSVWNEKSDIFFIATAKLNQDSLENLFYLIRSRGATNSNPSMYEFNIIMSKMLSMKIITSKTMSGNCEPNEEELLVNVIKESNILLQTNVDNVSSDILVESGSKDYYGPIIEAEVELSLEATFPSIQNAINDNALRYFAGYLLYKVIKRFNCDACADLLKPDLETLSSSEFLILNKEYGYVNKNLKLKAPIDYFFNLIKIHFNTFQRIFTTKPHISNLKRNLITACVSVTAKSDGYADWFSESHDCLKHREYMLNAFLLILIRKNCQWLTEKIIGKVSNSKNKVKILSS